MMVYAPIEIKEVLKKAPFAQGGVRKINGKYNSSIEEVNIDQPIRIPRETDTSNYEAIRNYFGTEQVETADKETLIALFLEELKCFFDFSIEQDIIRITRVLSVDESNIQKSSPIPIKLAKYYNINRDQG